LPLCAYVSTVAKLYVDQQVPLRRIPASDWPGAGGESALRKWASQPPASEVLARTYNAHIRCASHANPPKHDVSTAREEGGQRVDLGGRAGGCPQSRDSILSATLESALEDQLRQRRRKEWLVTNGDSIEAYNRDVEKRGTFGDSLRSF